MDSAQVVTLIAGALGGTGVLAILAKGLVQQWNGNYRRERGRNADIVQQRDDAYARAIEADREARFQQRMAEYEGRERRRVLEYASELRRDLVEIGIPSANLPPWPTPGAPPVRDGERT